MEITLWTNKILNMALTPWILGSLPIHCDMHFIEISSLPLKCQTFYCDEQLFSCITFHMDIHILYLCNIALHPMPLSLFRNTCELKKMHHLIVVVCRCMNKLVIGVIVIVQILELVRQMLAKKPTDLFSHCQRQHCCKVQGSVLRNICNGDKVCLLLF